MLCLFNFLVFPFIQSCDIKILFTNAVNKAETFRYKLQGRDHQAEDVLATRLVNFLSFQRYLSAPCFKLYFD